MYGGTFNPVHLGHLITAAAIREEFGLDRVILVPARAPVHKLQDPGASAEDRYRMIELAIRGCDGLEASRIEIDRQTPSYTIYTVQELRERHPGAQISLIMGADSFADIGSWMRHDELLSTTTVIIMRRPGAPAAPEEQVRCGREVLFARNPLLEISSSVIRERLRGGRPVRYLLPGAVLDYIREKELYTH